ncbi:hypothetical protein [Rufibacter sp. XAAS-G3-1]|uniref:hypothetical protein n=1 Tax=Rufibacter sp. XAAS-G3-1 TaxID=2729134 RepID=UPI0015E7BBC3|nr:hypothetical protein [Rufibacter sp. XAAS-G3-1]
MEENIANLENTNDFKIVFASDLHEIDANTLANFLISMNSIIQEVNRELESNSTVNVHITGFRKGSFHVYFRVIRRFLSSTPGPLTSSKFTNAADLITILSGLYGFAVFIGGQEPAKEIPNNNGVTIQNQQGANITVNNIVYNIYTTNSVVSKAIAKSSKVLENDKSIEGFVIANSEAMEIISIPRKNFSALSKPNQFLKKQTKRLANPEYIQEKISVQKELNDNRIETLEIKNAALSIIMLSFDSEQESYFLYDGQKISAKISDKQFIDSINQGRRFSKDDVFIVDLKLKREHYQSEKPMVVNNYEITNVIEHIPGGTHNSRVQNND